MCVIIMCCIITPIILAGSRHQTPHPDLEPTRSTPEILKSRHYFIVYCLTVSCMFHLRKRPGKFNVHITQDICF